MSDQNISPFKVGDKVYLVPGLERERPTLPRTITKIEGVKHYVTSEPKEGLAEWFLAEQLEKAPE